VNRSKVDIKLRIRMYVTYIHVYEGPPPGIAEAFISMGYSKAVSRTHAHLDWKGEPQEWSFTSIGYGMNV